MVIEAKNLLKRYGALTALDHLDIGVHEGEVFGLLGPNGSGKTTAINCILSLLEYEEGTIEVFGTPMTPENYAAKHDIGIVMQNVAVFQELTVYENIDYFCGLYVTDKARRRQLVDEAIAFTGLEDFRKFRPKKLSGGLLRRLNIACGIAHKPKLIILDEPTVAVDPQSRNRILEGITELNRNGATVVYTSHYMEEVEQICTRIMILDKGKAIAIGTKDELKKMVSIGEKVIVETAEPTESILLELDGLDGVASASYADGTLTVTSAKGRSSLENVLEILRSSGVPYSRIRTELPTLNDVFLELTGKELRD